MFVSSFLAATVAGLLHPVGALAEPDLGDLAQVETLQKTLADVADEVRPSVVAIRADRRVATLLDESEEKKLPDDEVHRRLREHVIPAVGSGVVISPDGLILTNEHVIQNAEPDHIECVLSDGSTYTVQAIASDPRSDLAVIRIDARDLKSARLGDVEAVKQGHFAIVMGNPFGSAFDSHGDPAMSFGIVSALGRELSQQLDPHGDRYYGNLIQTDARINPGNSGGPLLNIRGEVIGINTAISTRSGSSEGVGYAIPISWRTRQIIERLSQGEPVEYGFLGVGLEAPSPRDRTIAGAPSDGGARIKDVFFGTPAAEAELESGDIIVEFNGEPVGDVDHLIRLVGAAQVGVKVDATLYRNKKRLTVGIVPDLRPVKGVEVSFVWRGLRLGNITPETRSEFDLSSTAEGVVVLQVQSDSPAAKAGFEPGQVVRKLGDLEVRNIRLLHEVRPQLEGPIKVKVVEGEAEAERSSLFLERRPPVADGHLEIW